MSVIEIFLYLQLLDFLTTMAGLSLGASEASPFIAKLIHISSPAWGLAASKVIALVLGAFCVASRKVRLIGWINYWFASLIVWNLCILIVLGHHRVAH